MAVEYHLGVEGRRKVRCQRTPEAVYPLADPERFAHFDFDMCLAPQQGALFQDLNLQKRSGADVF